MKYIDKFLTFYSLCQNFEKPLHRPYIRIFEEKQPHLPIVQTAETNPRLHFCPFLFLWGKDVFSELDPIRGVGFVFVFVYQRIYKIWWEIFGAIIFHWTNIWIMHLNVGIVNGHNKLSSWVSHLLPYSRKNKNKNLISRNRMGPRYFNA